MCNGCFSSSPLNHSAPTKLNLRFKIRIIRLAATMQGLTSFRIDNVKCWGEKKDEISN